MIAVKNASGELPDIKAYGDLYVYLGGNHFQQDEQKVSNNVTFNIYCVYKLDPI